MSKKWKTANMPNLIGKIAIVTGGNVGLGYKSTYELARRGATVVIACRSDEKGKAAMVSIRKKVPSADLDVITLDLVDKESIARFAESFNDRYNQLNILLNNAGVVNLEKLQRTDDGNEMHMATNHLGHFALTGRLFPVLKATNGARVITVSSLAYKYGVIDFNDSAWKKRKYHRVKSYGDSKLANLLFMIKLQKIFDSTGATAISVAAHPGLTGTERQQTIGMGGIFARWIASPVDKGVLPQLLAATDPSVKPCEFYGPRYGIWGYPTIKKIKKGAINEKLADKLWVFSEELTGVKYKVI